MRAADLTLDTLRVEQTGRVLIARIDAPPFNFMTAAMQRDLDALTRAVDADASIGAVVLTGAPEDRYIPHFNIADILAAAEGATPLSEGAMRAALRVAGAAGRMPGGQGAIEASPLSGLLNITRFSEVVLRIMRSPAVWIAAINGPCGGGGLELSVCFDVRLIAEEAGVILPELLIGLTTPVGGQRLVALIGPGKALEMLLEGRVFTAAEARDMGLVGHVTPRAELLERALELAHRYAARNRTVVANQKRIFHEHATLSPADALRAEGAVNATNAVTGVAPRALRAWVQMQQDGDGDSVFFSDLEPWRLGEAVDLNAPRGG